MSSSSSKDKDMEGDEVTVWSCDGKEYKLEQVEAMLSGTMKLIIEDGCAADGIPIPMVNSTILSKVFEYCKKHAKAAATDDDKEELKSWDAEYMKVDEGTLYHLMLAANYLNIKGLLDLTAQTAADMIKGKTPQEIRKAFNIENDFTPEEEEAIRKEHEEWGLPTQQH